jgi:hypothetical protein
LCHHQSQKWEDYKRDQVLWGLVMLITKFKE